MADKEASEKKQKMLWLMEQVAENGYDTSKFNKYYLEKYKQKFDVNKIDFHQLKLVVGEYRVNLC